VQFVVSTPSESIPKATAAVQKALELDESLAEAHATLGIINLRYVWDLPAAEREFKRALELDPRYAPAHMWYSLYLAVTGRMNEGQKEMERAIELDPLSITVNKALGDYYFEMRRYDRALEQYRKTLEMDSSLTAAQVGIGRAYEQMGMYKEALEQFREVQRKSDSKRLPTQAGYTYALWGRKDEARKILNRLLQESRQSTRNPYMVAIVYAGLGEKSNALKWLETAYAEHALLPGPMSFDSRLDTLRTDARFKEILLHMGLPI
jgi:tetratricopeptide (TPR) repeat protein